VVALYAPVVIVRIVTSPPNFAISFEATLRSGPDKLTGFVQALILQDQT